MQYLSFNIKVLKVAPREYRRDFINSHRKLTLAFSRFWKTQSSAPHSISLKAGTSVVTINILFSLSAKSKLPEPSEQFLGDFEVVLEHFFGDFEGFGGDFDVEGWLGHSSFLLLDGEGNPWVDSTNGCVWLYKCVRSCIAEK